MSSAFNVGFNSMLKEGAKHLSGVEEAILRNVEACKGLAQVTRTSLGPQGLNKMVINRHDKLFVTSDAATIIKELDVVHPAAKMMVMASQMQEQEIGDGTNLVIVLGGELLHQAEALIRSGIHPSDIISGYTSALKKAQEILEGLAIYKLDDPRDVTKVSQFLKSVITAKQYGWEGVLTPIIANACIQVLPKNPAHFNVENIRVAKILGGGVTDTRLIKGFALIKDTEGSIKHVKDAKIAVLVAGIEPAKPETKGTVVLKDAEALLNFSKSEEKFIEDSIRQIAESGAKVIVSGGNFADIALHFIERYQLMAVRIPSKFDLRRLCKAIGATPLVRVGTPTQDELGFANSVSVDEIGDQRVITFQNDNENARLATIIARSSTQNFLDDLERCVDDAVNVYKGLIKDPRFVAGAGATELEIARQLQTFAESSSGLDQHAIKKFAEAFEVIPRTIAENSGANATELVASLYAAHENNHPTDGISVEGGEIKSAIDMNIYDLLATKSWAIKYAAETVITILRVDQIIMARPAGGPKVPRMGPRDSDD